MIPTRTIVSLLSLMLCTTACAAALAADDAIAPASQVNEKESTAALLDSKSGFEQKILALEQTPGAYSTELADAYYGLGSTLQSLGQHEEALTTLGKSLQAIRYSNGLQDMKQLPVLHTMLASSKSLAKWEDMDAQLQLIYYITSRQLAPGDDTRQSATLALGRWKLEAAQKELLPPRDQPVNMAINLYRNEIDHIKTDSGHGGKNLQLATLYLDLARAELWEARRIFEEPLRNYDAGAQPATTTQVQCETGRDSAGRPLTICKTVEVPNNNYYVGKTNTKNIAISMHTNVMRDSVKESLTILRQEAADSPQRKDLLEKTDKLILDYNNFMNMMAATIDPQIVKRASR